MISKEHNSVFVHIPKVAGQSIETMFLNELGLNWEQRSELLLRKKRPGEAGPERLAHLRARDYVDLGYISKEEFDNSFRFSFVRDPYKRAFSFYNFLGYSRIMSMKGFVEHVLPQKLKTDDFFFRSQYDYLYSKDGQLLVEFVGRLENIRTDIKQVVEKAGMPNASLPHVNKSKAEWNRGLSLLMRNPSYLGILKTGQRGKPYESVMTDEVKSAIYELYQMDFKHFGYSS